MSRVLLISIGPIQDFIASARKAQDLWFGSWLLSDLSRVVAEQLKKSGADLIFPGAPEFKDDTSVANKILARLGPAADPAPLAEEAHEQMKHHLVDMAEELFGAAKERAGELAQYFDDELAHRQLADLIEFLWVAVPIEGNDYKAARDRAEALLAARKNTKIWGPASWGAPVPKSSLDGLRESVLHEKLFDQTKKGGRAAERARAAFGIRPAERLCGVGLLKRLGQAEEEDGAERARRGRPVFHSTSHSAALALRHFFVEDGAAVVPMRRYLELLENDEVLGKEALRRFRLRPRGNRHPVGLCDHDGQLLFAERLIEAIEERHGKASARTRLASGAGKLAEQARRDVLKACDRREPPAYYALLLADGDRMGRAIDACKNDVDHKKISRALDGFAANANSIVTGKGGSLIYSGGDDVLALLPLDSAVDCARALADDFTTRMGAFSFDDAGVPRPPTLSVGLAVAHHLTPFSIVREQAKRAEKHAKQLRNALAISIDKRSGGETIVTGSWAKEDPDGFDAIDKRLREWRGLFAGGEIPHGFLHELSEIARLSAPWESSPPPNLEKMLSAEVTRILVRKQPDSGARERMESNVKKKLRAHLKTGGLAQALGELQAELYVALELHRATPDVSTPSASKVQP